MEDRHIEEKFITFAEPVLVRSVADPRSTVGGESEMAEILANSFKCST